MRISIIGHPASGKSTLARRISEKLNIPHIHIDRFWFEAGGANIKLGNVEEVEKARVYIKEKVLEQMKQDSWVSDGWYSKLQPIISEQADHLIFLDIPLYRRMLNHLQRIFKPGRHKELSKWDEIRFFYEIIYRTFAKGPKMKKFVREHSDKIKIFRNYKEVEKYLETL